MKPMVIKVGRPKKEQEEKLICVSCYVRPSDKERLKELVEALKQGREIFIQGESKPIPVKNVEASVMLCDNKTETKLQGVGISVEDFLKKHNIQPTKIEPPELQPVYEDNTIWRENETMELIYCCALGDMGRFSDGDFTRQINDFMARHSGLYSKLQQSKSEQEKNDIMMELYNHWKKEEE